MRFRGPKNFCWISVLVIGLFFFIGENFASAQLEVDPRISWKEMETQHFRIIYNAKQQEQANFYAPKLERAYQLLSTRFQKMPQKSVVVLNDRTDLTNGYATRIPYPHMVLFPVMPGPEDSLADTGDWAQDLVTHELTHLTTFEPADTWGMNFLKSIFGNILSPNILMPRWWSEGVAVEMETALSSHGRLRSKYQDSVIRALVLNKTMQYQTIAEANEVTPYWPEGMRPYLFGSLIWSQIHLDAGADAANQLTTAHGGRVPYMIDAPAKKVLGVNYDGEYEKAIDNIIDRTESQLGELQARVPTTYQLIETEQQYLSHPSISPDGMKMILIARSKTAKRSLVMIKKDSSEQRFTDKKPTAIVGGANEAEVPRNIKDGPPAGSITRVSWFSDSNRFVFDKVDYLNIYQQYSDLYVYDLKTNKSEPLTKSLRAREPSVSPSGNQVAFTKLDGGLTALAILKTALPTETEILFQGKMNQRVSYPTFISESKIAYSFRDETGEENIFVFDLETRENLKYIPLADSRFAKMTSLGLLFTSSQSGVNNVFMAESNGTAKPMTHVLTGAFDADLDPINKDLIFGVMTDRGPQVASASEAEWNRTPKNLPKVDSLLASRYQPPKFQEAHRLTLPPVEDYSYKGTLWPQYWIPFISGSSNSGGLLVQASTGGFDPLKHHQYAIFGAFDTGAGQSSVIGTYVNQQTTLPWTAAAAVQNSFLGSVNNKISDTFTELGVLPNVYDFLRDSQVLVGWSYLQRSGVGIAAKRTGPRVLWSYNPSTKSGEQVSPESGINGYLGAQNFLAMSDYISHSRFLAGGRYYFSKWLPERHALMIKLNAAYTPEKLASIYGVTSDSIFLNYDSSIPEYVIRGYLRGQFFGKNMAVANLEYRFPMKNMYWGNGTLPLFFRRVYGAVIADFLASDGLLVNTATGNYDTIRMKQIFSTVGFEFRLETTLGYTFPTAFIFGLYNPRELPEKRDIVFGTTLQLGGF